MSRLREWSLNTIGFAGEQQDPTGLYNLRARAYDPTIGQMLTTDPIDHSTAAPLLSAYGYANGNPSSLVDPSGMSAQCAGVWNDGCALLNSFDPSKFDVQKGIASMGVAADFMRHGYWNRDVSSMDIEGYAGTYMDGFDPQFSAGGSVAMRGLGDAATVGVGMLDYMQYRGEGESRGEALLRAGGRATGSYGGAEVIGGIGCAATADTGPGFFIGCPVSILVGGLVGGWGGGHMADGVAGVLYG